MGAHTTHCVRLLLLGERALAQQARTNSSADRSNELGTSNQTRRATVNCELASALCVCDFYLNISLDIVTDSSCVSQGES
ncbi:hypothetical protein evm_006426, partial [Chilo suppressalis]